MGAFYRFAVLLDQLVRFLSAYLSLECGALSLASVVDRL